MNAHCVSESTRNFVKPAKISWFINGKVAEQLANRLFLVDTLDRTNSIEVVQAMIRLLYSKLGCIKSKLAVIVTISIFN